MACKYCGGKFQFTELQTFWIFFAFAELKMKAYENDIFVITLGRLSVHSNWNQVRK